MQLLTDTATPIATAEIVAVQTDAATVWVRRSGDDVSTTTIARLAVPWSRSIQAGARVLVAEGAAEEHFVIGVLSQPLDNSPRRIETTDGVVVETARQADGELLSVHSENGELLFQYDASQKRTRVFLREGDIEFLAASGSISFAAQEGICLRSQNSVAIHGNAGVQIHAGKAFSTSSSLCLHDHDTQLTAPRLAIKTPQLDVTAAESRFTGRNLLARFVRTSFITKHAEAIMETLVQKAENVFRRVAGLDEVHAKYSRTLVEDSIHVKAGQVNMKADKDVRINGEQIHLG